MKKIQSTLYFILLVVSSKGQFNETGYPFFTYYDSKDYSANDQNWDVIEDQNGLIYVANNNDGILQFDGETWRKIEIENKAEVRSFAMDSSGVIYVGCSNDFGYLSPDIEGNLVFNSLVKNNKLDDKKFSYIYKINIIADTVFFSSDTYLLFKYNIKDNLLSVTDLPAFTLFTFAAGNKLFGSGYLDGIYERVKDTVEVIKEGEFYKKKNIFSILPDTNSLTVVTGGHGIYKYNYNSGKSVQFLTDNSYDYLTRYLTYSATKSSNEILLATIGSGIVGLNQQGKILKVYDQQIGIKDHIVASINSFRNSIWSALSFGIVRVEDESPFRYFSKESNLEGYIIDIIRLNNTLYVGTEIGLFYMDEKVDQPSTFVKIEGIENQIRSMQKMSIPNELDGEILVIGTLDGIYQLNCNKKEVQLIKIHGIEKYANLFIEKSNDNQDEEVTFYVSSLIAQKNSNKLWVGTKSQRLVCLEYKNSNWYFTDQVFDIGDGIDIITTDINNNIWVATKQNGLVKIDKTTLGIVKYNVDSGLPVNYSLKLFNTSTGLFCATPKGIYKYDLQTDKFLINPKFPEKYSNGLYGVESMIEDGQGNYYINYYTDENKGIDEVVWNKLNGNYEILDYFKRLGNVLVNFFYNDNELVWFGISDVLYNYNKNIKLDYSEPYKCLIRKVEGIDSTYFYGAFFEETSGRLVQSNIQHNKQKPVLDYAYNDITFHYAATYYEGSEAIEYSYLLDGFKTEWSKWSKEPKAVFTNLNEGNYLFNVKAKNIYGVESQVGTYEFTVLPPWYRTILAYFLYVVIALMVVWLIVKLYTRRLKQEKIRLEGIVRERTAEIREQRDEIAEQKHSIESSIVYARRIQRAILPSDELAEEILPEHFILFRPRDIVSGDYFWMNKIGNHTIVVAADCTGHGVPGAFMSMLGVSFLNEIVLKDSITEPHLILNKLRERVKKTLKQEGKEGEAKDGMDVAVVVFDETNNKLYFAGAYNPAYIYRGTELFELKADRMPIGIYIKEKESFTLNEFDYQKGDTFYIFSDGYPDQFGGETSQKFKTKALKELLASIQNEKMDEQKEILNKVIEDWMGLNNEQTDDMVIVGIRF